MRIAVLADTHVPKRAKTLPADVWRLINTCDLIVHAGDVLNQQFLDELRSHKPLLVVRGNNDVGLADVPETLETEVAGKKLAIIHDSGSKAGRAKRMRKRFPTADIVVFGHSHVPLVEEFEGMLLFNPGSPTDRRMQPKATMGLIEIDGEKVTPQIVEIA